MEEKIIKIIEENPIAISTCTKEGEPNISVAAFVKIKDRKIIITNNYMEKTIENIKQNPKIILAAWNKDWEGCKVKGTAEYFEDGEWMEFVKKIPENKEEPCKGVIVITPTEAEEIG